MQQGAKQAEESLYKSIDGMSQEQLDALPQGAIQLDSGGTVLKYNLYEERLASTNRKDVIGRNFFKEVAPCTAVKEFYGRFIEGVKQEQLHETFRFHFSFHKNPTDVSITLFYSPTTESMWVFVRKLE